MIFGRRWLILQFIGFNKSHSTSYSIISYNCAWLFTYYPNEWLAAYLDCVEEKKKEAALNIVKSFGFKIKSVDINKSSNVWEISEEIQDGEIVKQQFLVQPLTSIKGFGEVAFKEIIENRPFRTIEELILNPKIEYNKLTKKSLDVLARSGALDNLIDDRFSGRKHFWASISIERPKTLKKFQEYIELYRPEGDFSEEEIIEFETSLAGNYPINKVVKIETIKEMKEKGILAISDFQENQNQILCWFVIKNFDLKKTKLGKDYLVVETIDLNNESKKVKCWRFQ